MPMTDDPASQAAPDPQGDTGVDADTLLQFPCAAELDRRLGEQVRFFQSLLDAMPSPVFYKDLEGRYQGCNRAFERMFAVERGNLIGKTVHELWPTSEAALFHKQDMGLMARGGLQIYESRVTSATGVSRHVMFHKRGYRDADGKLAGLVGVVLDITERKLAEQAMVESKEKLHVILQNVPVGVALIGNDQRVLELNNQGRRWFPAADSPDGLKSFSDPTNPLRMVLGDASAVEQTLRDGQVHEGVAVENSGNGKRYRVVASPVLDPDGKVTAAIQLVTDVTDRLRAEEAESERRALQQTVASMEQAFGVIGHELRTPLASMRMIAELLLAQREKRVSELETFLRSILAQSQQMAELVNRLLETARLCAGDARWDWGAVRVADLLEQAAAVVHPLIDATQVRFDYVPCDDDLEVLGDGEALRRLAINLLTNAARHTQRGAIRLHATAHEHDGGRWLHLMVADTGDGIAPERLEQLGKPFVLGGGAVGSDWTRGAGLGLAISRAIAGAHGGVLRVASAVGMGSTFTAELRADLSEPARQEGKVIAEVLQLPEGAEVA